MYDIFTYIYHKNPMIHVGKYSIRRIWELLFLSNNVPKTRSSLGSQMPNLCEDFFADTENGTHKKSSNGNLKTFNSIGTLNLTLNWIESTWKGTIEIETIGNTSSNGQFSGAFAVTFREGNVAWNLEFDLTTLRSTFVLHLSATLL